MRKFFAWAILLGFLTANLDSCTGCSKSGGGRPKKSGGAGCTSCSRSKKNGISNVGEEYKRIKNELEDLKLRAEKNPNDKEILLQEAQTLEQNVKSLIIEVEGEVINNGISIVDQESGQTSLLTVAMIEDLVRDVSRFKEQLQSQNEQNITSNTYDNRAFFVGRYEVISNCDIAKGSITTIKSNDYDDELKQRVDIGSFCGRSMHGIVAFKNKEILIEDTPLYVSGGYYIEKGKISFGNTITFTLEIRDSSTPCTGTLRKIE